MALISLTAANALQTTKETSSPGLIVWIGGVSALTENKKNRIHVVVSFFDGLGFAATA